MLVEPYLNDRTYYDRLTQIVLLQDSGRTETYGIRELRYAGERLLVHLQGISSREDARAFTGTELLVPRHELPPPPEGEFYWFDLQGLSVYTLEGEYLGRVTDFLTTGSNEVLMVRDGEREILIPFIRDVIAEVDETTGRIYIRMIPGLM